MTIEAPTSPCPCGAARYRLVEAGVSHRNLPDFAYALYACEACGLVRTAPEPGEETYTHGDEATRARIANEEAYRGFARSVLADLKRHAPGGRLLDVGCNIGLLVEEAQRAGYEAWGIDLDPVAVSHGQSQGRRLTCGPVQGLEAPAGGFDVIVVNHVLEHVPAVGEFLRALETRLAPGGVLAVNVPNYAGWVPRMMKANWGALWPHQHVWQFTPATLRALVERETGLRCRAMDTSHNLEPPSTADLKGLVKRAVVAASVVSHQADELRAVFVKA